VTPLLTKHDLADCSLVQSIPFRDRGLGHLRIQRANRSGVVLGEFSAWMRRAVRMSAFAALVFVVIGRRPYEQVGRITARRIIAPMQNVSAFWHWTVDALVGDAMRANLSTMFVLYDPVTFFVACSGPQPAGAGLALVAERIEPNGQWLRARAVAARLRTIWSAWPTRRTELALVAERCVHAQHLSTNGAW
jgi:hypothetical protein